MTSLIQNLPLPFASAGARKAPARNAFDLSPQMRAIVALAATAMSLAAFYAIARGMLGFAPDHEATRHLAVVIHVATVLPAIPLGGFLLLAPKGTPMHKQLGKLWVALMVTTALSAIFIKTSGSFSFIHIFIPMTLWASYKLIATARRGDMKGHKKEILSLYLGALMIPGVVSMALPGRLMNVWLFG
ncbi:MAG: DUF2306 domain-containing protein [Pseudomonadota bacterium]